MQIIQRYIHDMSNSSLHDLINQGIIQHDIDFVTDIFSLDSKKVSAENLLNLFSLLAQSKQLQLIEPFITENSLIGNAAIEILTARLANYPLSITGLLASIGEVDLLKTILVKIQSLSHNTTQDILRNISGIPEKTLADIAIEYEQPSVITLLISMGITVEKLCEKNPINNQHVFHTIAQHNALRFITFFSDIGMSFNNALMRDNEGNSVIHIAAEQGHHEIITAFLQKGIPPKMLHQKNKAGFSALDLAAKYDHPQIITLFNKPNLQLEQAGSSNFTPIQIAAKFGSTRFIQYAFEHAQLTHTQIMSADKKGVTIAHLAAAEGRTTVIEKLLEIGLEKEQLFAPSKTNQTLSHYAAINGHINILKQLFDITDDADYLNTADKSGYTPAILAARNNHHSIIQTMLELGVSLDSIMTTSPKGKKNILHYAARNNNIEILRILRRFSLTSNRLNQPDYYRATPGSIARKHGHADFIRQLILHGVAIEPYAAPYVGETADIGQAFLNHIAVFGGAGAFMMPI